MKSLTLSNLLMSGTPNRGCTPDNGPTMDRKRTDYAPARLFAVITMLLMLYSVGIESTWATPKATYTWTASPATDKDKFSSTSGNATLGSYTWAYTQGTARTNYASSNPTGYIQLGAKNNSVGAFTLTLTNTDPITSVTVNCASYSASSNISISIGGTSYLSSTATTSWNATTGGGNSGGSVLATPLTGNVQISFTASSRALYIKSITIVYGEAAASCTDNPSVGAASVKGTYKWSKELKDIESPNSFNIYLVYFSMSKIFPLLFTVSNGHTIWREQAGQSRRLSTPPSTSCTNYGNDRYSLDSALLATTKTS